MKLLVVDDHCLIREAVRHVVQAPAESVTALTARDGGEGFAIAGRESDLEVLLLHFNLRGSLSGLPAITAWHQRHPALPAETLARDDSAPALAAEPHSQKSLGLGGAPAPRA